MQFSDSGYNQGWRTFPALSPLNFKRADVDYLVVYTCMIPCSDNFLQALKSERPAETTGEDNLEKRTLVSAAFDSARSGETIEFAEPSESVAA